MGCQLRKWDQENTWCSAEKTHKMQHAARRGPQGSAGFRNALGFCFAMRVLVAKNLQSTYALSKILYILATLLLNQRFTALSSKFLSALLLDHHVFPSPAGIAGFRRDPSILWPVQSSPDWGAQWFCADARPKFHWGVGFSFGFNQYLKCFRCFLLYLGLSLFFSPATVLRYLGFVLGLSRVVSCWFWNCFRVLRLAKDVKVCSLRPETQQIT